MEYVAMDVVVILAEVREMKMTLRGSDNWTDEQVARFCADMQHLNRLGLVILGNLIREGKMTQKQYWTSI